LEANTHSAGQEVSRLLWSPKVYYRVQKIPPTGPSSEPAESNPHFPTLLLLEVYNYKIDGF